MTLNKLWQYGAFSLFALCAIIGLSILPYPAGWGFLCIAAVFLGLGLWSWKTQVLAPQSHAPQPAPIAKATDTRRATSTDSSPAVTPAPPKPRRPRPVKQSRSRHLGYTCLYKRRSDDDVKTSFAFFQRGASQAFQQLADMAEPENWNFRSSSAPQESLPILTNYLNYTFLRLQQQSKIKIKGDWACFNTGLQTSDSKDIFAVFKRNPQAKDNPAERSDWLFEGWYDSYAPQVTRFGQQLPEVATYIEDARDFIFDPNYHIEINTAHILDENRERLPAQFRDDRGLAMRTVEGAVSQLRRQCQKNYALAIPFWYPKQGKIQLMLPLYLSDSEQPDLALVADKDEQGRVYRIRTALSLEQAYNNARLVSQQPAQVWLQA